MAADDLEDVTIDDDGQLWATWTRTRDPSSRNAIVERHRNLAHRIAAAVLRERGYPPDIDLQDLRQQATVELLAAVDRFDPTLGVPFSAFVKKRVRGALLDAIAASSELHAQTEWRRSMAKERVRSIQDAGASSLNALERVAEVAVGLAVGIMLEGTGMHAPAEPAIERTDPYAEAMDLAVLTRRVRSMARRLKEPDQFVVRAHYEADYSFVEIADRLDLSPSRVSQIHGRALRTIRTMLTEHGLDRRV